MTKTGARQGCIAIQPLHLRHGVGAGRAGKGTRQVGAQAGGTGGGGGGGGAGAGRGARGATILSREWPGRGLCV